MWDNIFSEVKKNLPEFNRFLLKDYRKTEINRCADYISIVYKEAVKLFDNPNEKLEYIGYRTLSPQERVEYQLNSKWQNSQIDIRISELELYEYKFLFQQKEYMIYLYLPYSSNDAIVISGISYYMLLAIVERVIYHIENGINIKVMRSPLHFWRLSSPTYSTTNGLIFMDPLIIVKAHSKSVKKSKSGAKTSVILYLLTQYGLNGTLEKFGFSSNSLIFTENDIYTDRMNGIEVPEYLHNFVSIKIKDNIYINIKEEYLENKYYRRIVTSIINAFKSIKKCSLDQINMDIYFWKFLLGKCIYGNAISKDALLINHVNNHLKSLSTYLDPITIMQLDKLDIHCKNIYELFAEVFLKLDDWLVNKTVTNLYEKKISVLELLLAELVKRIFKHFYDIEQKHQALTKDNIGKLLKINSKIINNIYACDVLHSSPSQYNDNALISILGRKIRQPANQNSRKKQIQENILNSPDHRFDATFGGIESLFTIPSSNPGIGGSINPFAIIDEEGCLIEPDWIKPLKELTKYLPRS
jgi:hypothetical protein